jgi:hypothetical protein
VTVNGAVMGSEITSSGPPRIEYQASSQANVKTVSIVKIARGASGNLGVTNADNTVVEGIYVDHEFSADSAYMVRLDLNNDDMVVSSPVWVKKA